MSIFLQNKGFQIQVLFIIFDDQDFCHPGSLDWECKFEGATRSPLALDVNFPAHGSHETLADRQAQSCAFVTARQPDINLLEWLEEFVHILELDPNPMIAHPGFQAARSQLTFDSYLAMFTELDGVVNEIDQYLFDSTAVIVNDAHPCSHGCDQLQALLLS